MVDEEELVVCKEVEEILKKKAITSLQKEPKHFLSSIFVDPKKSEEFLPIISLKKLSSCVEYNHFKMEGLFLLNGFLEKDDYLCRLDLNDAYFLVPFYKESQRFQ